MTVTGAGGGATVTVIGGAAVTVTGAALEAATELLEGCAGLLEDDSRGADEQPASVNETTATMPTILRTCFITISSP